MKPCYNTKFVTCGQVCTENLCKNGSKPNMCDVSDCISFIVSKNFMVHQYCHRKPKLSGYNQCGTTCRDGAKDACLLCKSRPKFGRYHLCGQTCKKIATKGTPLVLEAPPGHSTYDLARWISIYFGIVDDPFGSGTEAQKSMADWYSSDYQENLQGYWEQVLSDAVWSVQVWGSLYY